MEYHLKPAARPVVPICEDLNARPSFADMLGTAERELASRVAIYPQYVHTGKMTNDAAKAELANMRAIVAHLKKLVIWNTPDVVTSVQVGHDRFFNQGLCPRCGETKVEPPVVICAACREKEHQKFVGELKRPAELLNL